MSGPTFDRLYREISETQKRRRGLDIIKITFVSALLGFGAVRINDITQFYQVLYVAPLIAVFLDFLVMGEHFAVRRIGVFLRLHPEAAACEQEYESFVSRHRDWCFVFGSKGFTTVSFVAAIILLYTSHKGVLLWEWAWFGGVYVLFAVGSLVSARQLRKLDALDDWKQVRDL